MASTLISAGSALSDLVNDYMDKPCNTFCKDLFTRSRPCLHGFKFCTVCNELWCETMYPICPRHACAYQMRNMLRGPGTEQYHVIHVTDITIKKALSAHQPYTTDDVVCDDVCDYAFDKLGYKTCRHNMSKCPSCQRMWFSKVECNCYLEFLDDDDSSSDDSCITSSDNDENDDDEPESKVPKKDE